ncbi:hypothetical protein ACFFIX_16445 [Metabacillus herbersteinensis]|uniref:Uncharacterized protein n=1 Tax=Metabacillus herbersteinensis TaxID=283816 RepID=A0ABV6GH56_9BACI
MSPVNYFTNKIEVPEDLKDHKEDLDAAVKNLTESYHAKAEELAKENPTLDVANETFVQGEEKLGNYLKISAKISIH